MTNFEVDLIFPLINSLFSPVVYSITLFGVDPRINTHYRCLILSLFIHEVNNSLRPISTTFPECSTACFHVITILANIATSLTASLRKRYFYMRTAMNSAAASIHI